MPSKRSKSSTPAEAFDPSYVALDLTYRCGFNCPFCFVKNNSLRKPGRRELSTAGFKRLISAFAGRPRRFYVTGGEPTLRADLPELVRHIKAAGHSCLVTTNAYALDLRRARRLAAAGPDEVVISLHGGPAAHDLAAGRPGAFRRAAAAVRLFRSLPEPRPRVTLWCTINRANHAQLPAVYQAMKAIGPDHLAFNHLEFVSRKDLQKTAAALKALGRTTPLRAGEALARGINPAALAAGVAAVLRADPAVKFYPDLGPAAIRAWYDPARSFTKPGRCSGQWNAAWFSPYGDLLTCQPLAVRISGPGVAPAAACSSPAAASFRRALTKAGGFFPACARCGREPFQRQSRRS
ncbi:MAG: radical SAM protein [Elusimicrobiales bacterium]|nr:radical SAM protein [Elusimicrobiales bacterium]